MSELSTAAEESAGSSKDATADCSASLTYEDAIPIAAMLVEDLSIAKCTPIPHHLPPGLCKRAQQLGFKFYKNVPTYMLAASIFDRKTKQYVDIICIGFMTRDVFVEEDGIADVGHHVTMAVVYLDQFGMLWGQFEDDHCEKFGDEASMIRRLPLFCRGIDESELPPIGARWE